MKITPREKRRHAAGREKNFLSPRRVSPFLAWGDFHARSRFARSTIPEEKWGTTRSLFLLSPFVYGFFLSVPNQVEKLRKFQWCGGYFKHPLEWIFRGGGI